MNKNQEILRAVMEGKLPLPPIADLIGIRLTSFEDGSATMEMEAGKKHWNPMKTVHGGILCDIADAAMGAAFLTTLADGENYTTVDLSIKFLKPVIEGRITAQANVVKRGKRLGYIECELRDTQGELIAKADSTCIVIKQN
jgi:uncharacterized protein (TIGR00369 family)